MKKYIPRMGDVVFVGGENDTAKWLINHFTDEYKHLDKDEFCGFFAIVREPRLTRSLHLCTVKPVWWEENVVDANRDEVKFVSTLWSFPRNQKTMIKDAVLVFFEEILKTEDEKRMESMIFAVL